MTDECALNGTWKLQFTSGADATFPESTKRGKATTSQIINATEGTLTNNIDFERGKVKGFKVVVEGEAISEVEMNLNFKRVVIERESKWPRLFGTITIRLPILSFSICICSLCITRKNESTASDWTRICNAVHGR